MPLRDLQDEGDYDYDVEMANAPTEPIYDRTTFDYPGPIAWDFANSDRRVRLIMGPFGSGKTSASCFEHITRAIRMPFRKDGWREYKGLVVRDTYRNLYKTSIQSWWEWFPPQWGKWSGGQDRPAQHIIEFEDDYGPVRLIMDFAAVGDQNVEQFFKGYAIVGVQFEEMDGLPEDAIAFAIGRAGRFPKKTDLLDPEVDFWRGVWGTCNAPDTDHWIYKKFVEDVEKTGYGFFKQPGGLSPLAENKTSLPDGYYEDMLSNEDWWIRKNVHNEFGYSRDGEPVYRDEFDDGLHFSQAKLTPVKGVSVDVGVDAGGHPAAVFRQVMPNGQRRYYRELVNVSGGVGPRRFSEQVNDVLDTDFQGCPIGEVFGDPSCFFGGDRESGELNWGQTFINLTGLKMKPAPSNEIAIRLDSVRQALEGRIDGKVAEILFCPSMKNVRRGFNSGYRFVKDNKGNVNADAKPKKTGGYSDPQDAIQYIELGGTGLDVVTGRAARRKVNRQQRNDRRGRRAARRASGGNLSRGGFNPL